MAYGIVQQSKGHISLRSQPGQGTRFEVHLPANAEEDMSGYTERDLLEGGMDNGDQLLQKPFTGEALAMKIREALAKKKSQ